MKSVVKVFIILLFFPFSAEINAQTFFHPGALHTESDFVRMKDKVSAGAEPWQSSYQRLSNNWHAQLDYNTRETEYIYRGNDQVHAENYSRLMYDVAAAYNCALRWKVSGDSAYADKAIEIMNVWAYTLKDIAGWTEQTLCEGLQGYQFANAGEMMRDYPGWEEKDFEKFKEMIRVHFARPSIGFLDPDNGRYGTCISHYWANWGLAAVACGIAAGIFLDDRDMYEMALYYYKEGHGNEAIKNLVPFVHNDSMGQWQESGRDQGHCLLGVGLAAAVNEMVWNQGEDLYAMEDNRLYKGINYVAYYNLWNDDVPYTTYNNCDNVNQTVIGSGGRGGIRPIWEVVYNHYANRMGWDVPLLKEWAETVRPEGGGGDYGSTSGGYDQHGFGTLTCYNEPGNVLYNWQHNDIGMTGSNGKANKSGDTIRVEAAGENIDGETDKFHYVFQRLIADGNMVVKLSDLDNNTSAKAGLMIRETLDPGSKNVMVGLIPGSGLFFQSRSETNGATTINTGGNIITSPCYLKLSRTGDTISAATSVDSTIWTEAGSEIIQMKERIYIGMAVSSGSAGTIFNAEFTGMQKIQLNIAPYPEIELTADNDSAFIAGEDISVDVTVFDFEDNVSKVEFYVNDTLIGEDTVFPYSFLWKSVESGNYALKARAIDNPGASRFTEAVNIKVREPGEKFPWYRFDEESGIIIAYDANGYGLDAKLISGFTRIPGPVNNAFSFDGVDDYVLLPEGVVSLLNNFSITTWAKFNSIDTWSRIFDFGSDQNVNMFLTPQSGSGNPRFTIKVNSETEQYLEATETLHTDLWTHIALTQSGDTCIIYFDGEEVGKTTSMELRPYMLGTTTRNYLGKSQWPDPYLNGYLDEFRIYNYALNQKDILAMVEDTSLFGYLSRDSHLKSLSFEADSMKPEFDPDIFYYDVYLPAGSTDAPDPVYELSHEAASALYFDPWNINDTVRKRNWGYIDVTAEYEIYKSRYSIQFHVAGTTGIKSTTHNNKIRFYPNPLNQNATLEWDADAGINRIELMNLTGKSLRIFENTGENKLVIRREGLSSGLYLLKFSGMQNGVLKVMIE